MFRNLTFCKTLKLKCLKKKQMLWNLTTICLEKKLTSYMNKLTFWSLFTILNVCIAKINKTMNPNTLLSFKVLHNSQICSIKYPTLALNTSIIAWLLSTIKLLKVSQFQKDLLLISLEPKNKRNNSVFLPWRYNTYVGSILTRGDIFFSEI